MSDGLRFIPERIPFLDQRTGLVSRPWYLLLFSLYNRTGGTTGDTGGTGTVAEELSQAPPAQVVIEPVDILLAEVSNLREQVAELRKLVESLQQGNSVI